MKVKEAFCCGGVEKNKGDILTAEEIQEIGEYYNALVLEGCVDPIDDDLMREPLEEILEAQAEYVEQDNSIEIKEEKKPKKKSKKKSE